jgi:hypothetical protein
VPAPPDRSAAQRLNAPNRRAAVLAVLRSAAQRLHAPGRRPRGARRTLEYGCAPLPRPGSFARRAAPLLNGMRGPRSRIVARGAAGAAAGVLRRAPCRDRAPLSVHSASVHRDSLRPSGRPTSPGSGAIRDTYSARKRSMVGPLERGPPQPRRSPRAAAGVLRRAPCGDRAPPSMHSACDHPRSFRPSGRPTSPGSGAIRDTYSARKRSMVGPLERGPPQPRRSPRAARAVTFARSRIRLGPGSPPAFVRLRQG